MSIEDTIRTIIREEITAALSVSGDMSHLLTEGETPEAEAPTPEPAKKKKKKAKAKRKAAAKPAPTEEDTEDVPTTYEGLMERIKGAVMELPDSTAAKVACQDWIEESYGTRKFSELPVEEYAEVLVGVLDVVAAL